MTIVKVKVLAFKDRPIRRCPVTNASTIHKDVFKETFNVQPIPIKPSKPFATNTSFFVVLEKLSRLHKLCQFLLHNHGGAKPFQSSNDICSTALERRIPGFWPPFSVRIIRKANSVGRNVFLARIGEWDAA